MTYEIWIDLNTLKQSHRQMRERFGHWQFTAVFTAIRTLLRADAPAGENVAVTAREFIARQDRRVAPGLASDRRPGRQPHEKTRGDHYRRLVADLAREADDVAFALARRLQRQIFAPLEKIAVVSAVVERASRDEHLDPSVRGRAQQIVGQKRRIARPFVPQRIEQAFAVFVIDGPAVVGV